MTRDDRLFKQTVQRPGYVDMGESIFDFLARGGIQGASEIREWMEQEWSEIPCGRRKGLRKRIMSKDFGQFMGSYSELLVHCLLRHLAVGIEIEPTLPGTTKTVDFRCTAHGGIFFVETTVTGMGGVSAKQNLNDAIKKINESVVDPHSHVDLTVKGRLETTLPKEEIVTPILGLLHRCSAEEVRRHETNRTVRGPSFVPIATRVVRGSWEMTAELRAAQPGKAGKIWGPDEVDDVVADDRADVSMEEALRNKARHWRGLVRKDEIFFVAINACHGLLGLQELEERVGRVIYNNSRGRVSGLECASFLRDINGVIVFDNATLGNERGALVKLYRNGQEHIPDCLKCLLQGRPLGPLIGLR